MPKYSEQKVGRANFKMEEFDSIHDFITEIHKRPLATKTHPGREQSSLEVDNSKKPWAGTKSYDEAQQLMETGWTTVAAKLTKRVPVQTKSGNANKTRPVYSVVGGTCSVPRYLQGIPTSMIDRRQTPMKSKIIVVNKDMSFPAMVSADSIFEEGVKALQIIQGLEGKGYRVKLNMVWAIEDSNEIVALRVVVKRPDDRLSIQKMAFPLAHPAMLRRIGFKWLETCPFTTKSYHGYGRPATNELKLALDKKEIFLPREIPDVDKFIENLNL